jgi:hypothetical protein
LKTSLLLDYLPKSSNNTQTVLVNLVVFMTEASPVSLLKDWHQRLRLAQFAHYESAKSYERYNYLLGVPAIMLSTFVGTSVFANLEHLTDKKFQVFVGLTSTGAAVFSAMQTFLRFSEKAEKHRVAAFKYGALRREIEEILIIEGSVSRDVISLLRHSIDRLSEEMPNVPSKVWRRKSDVVKEDKKDRVGLF